MRASHESLALAQYGALTLVHTGYILAILDIGVDDVAAARRTTAAVGAVLGAGTPPPTASAP